MGRNQSVKTPNPLHRFLTPLQGAVETFELAPGAARKAACPWLPSAAPLALVELFRFTVYDGSMKATWNNAEIAKSDKTVVVEGNHYFPPETVNKEYFQDSSTHTTCPWKGEASYYDVVVDGQVNKDAAWYYPEPKDAAAEIKDHVAFWRGVKIDE